MNPPLSAALMLSILLGSPMGACTEQDRGRVERSAGATAEAVEPARLEVGEGHRGLVFRYVDPDSGRIASATTVEDVPVAARKEVVVFAAEAPAPPGWEHVLDLSRGLPAHTTPTRGFALRSVVRADPTATASEGVDDRAGAHPPKAIEARKAADHLNRAHEVVMFTTRHCGFCKKARRYLRGRGIAYSDFDVERDPKASARMAEMARRAGVEPSSLQGVPILFIDGQPVVGFDKARVARLLGT